MASLLFQLTVKPASPFCQKGRGRVALWLASVFLLGVAMGLPVTAQSASNYQFSTNPADRQYDYFDPGRRGASLLDNVEKGHLVPGRRHLAEGNFRQAHDNLDFVLRWYPNHPQALDLYSKLAMKRGQPQSALPYFDYALRFSGKDISTAILYGIHRFRMGDYSKAVARFRQALALNPQSAEAHYNLGLTHLQLKEFGKARRHAHKAYELGYPLPGLRDKLRAQGQWQLTSGETARQ